MNFIFPKILRKISTKKRKNDKKIKIIKSPSNSLKCNTIKFA